MKKTKNTILNEIAKEKTVETIINNMRISKTEKKEDLEELSQYIYLSLLEKTDESIIGLYKRDELNYFIARMIRNNMYSKNSRYEYDIRKWTKNRTELKNNQEDNL